MISPAKKVLAIIVDSLPEDCWNCWCCHYYGNLEVHGCTFLDDEIELIDGRRDPKCLLMTTSDFIKADHKTN